MSIKSIVTQITGMSGLIPNFAFIDTSDSIDTITSVGYLNGAVLEGFSFSDSQMVLVTSTDGLFWYQISISNGNTSLVLPISPANVLLPVFEGDIASFTNNKGQIGSTNATIRHGGNIQAGENGIPGEFISFPTFTDTGRFIVKATSNSDDFDVTLTNMSHNQQTTYSIPDCGDDNGMLLNKAESSVFVNGNLIAADGANGVTIDSGIAATDVQLNTNIVAANDSIGGEGAGPISVSVANCTTASIVNATIASSSNPVQVRSAVCTNLGFNITFTGDPGAVCVINYIVYRVPQF